MIKFSHLLPILLLTTVGITAKAQNYSFAPVDEAGRAVPGNKYQHIKGSPFIFDEWVPGEVVTAAGKLHKGMLLKYNIVTDLLTFVYKQDEEPLKFAEPITAFTIFAERKMSFANEFPKIDGNGKGAYYEVIAVGKTMLLKHYRQYLKETRGADLTKSDATYVHKATYYLFKDGKMAHIVPGLKSIQNAFADKSAQLDSFLMVNTINFENEDDLKKIFDYYNGLTAE